MIKKLLTLGLVGLSLTACAQAGTSQPSASSSSIQQTSSKVEGKIVGNTSQLAQTDQDAIIKSYEDFCQALMKKDMSAIDAALPDNFIAVHITGKRQTKQEWLADIESGEMNYFDFLDINYTLTSDSPDRAQLAVSQRIHAKIYGVESTWSIPGSWTYEKKDGQWVMVV